MSDLKFKKHKFISYLTVGLTLFVCWAGINYLSIRAESVSAQENVAMIIEEVDTIQEEQYQLMDEQLMLIESIPVSAARTEEPSYSIESNDDEPVPVMSPAPVASAPPVYATPTPEVISPEVERYVEIDNEIADREAMKAELLEELEAESMTLGESFQALRQISQIDVNNPIVNFLILGPIGWILKKTIDFGFARLEERFHHE